LRKESLPTSMLLLKNKLLPVLVLGLICTFRVQAQEPVQVERSDNKVILGGKVYFIHMVRPGQTLYSIARAYHVSEKEIAVENPGAISGLVVGQALKIPVEPSLDAEIDTSEPEDDHPPENVHRVRPGETIYSISRLYGLSGEDVLAANPGVDPDDMKPGLQLVIPPKPEPKVEAEPAYNEEGFAYHTVKRKETLYSIARYYEVSVADLRKVNPEVGWGGPREGQVIRIPVPQVADKGEAAPDSLVAEDVAGWMTEKEMVAYDYAELLESHDNRRRVYRIAFLIPFDFTEPEPLDSLLRDVKSASRRARIIEQYRVEQRVPQSVPFLEFFQGALLALDSLSTLGMRMDVRFYDTGKSMARTGELLMDPDMRDLDLIIGPFYPFNLDLVAYFAKEEKIPVVTPFFSGMTYIWDNPYLFQPSPTLEDGYRDLARLVASKHDYNIVYVREEDSLNIEKHHLLKEMIFDGFDDYRPEDPVIFKEMVLTLNHTDEIIQSLSRDRKNLVVVPTRNEALASRVVSVLYYELRDFDIELVGTPYWTEFSSIDYRYFHELGLIFYNPFWMDYLDPEVEEFLKNYRNHFYGEPVSMTRKGINYGIAGFDMTMYFGNALKVYGRRFILHLEEYRPPMVQKSYNFKRVSRAGGYVNTANAFYRFHPDMTISSYEVPELPRRRYFLRPMDAEKDPFLIDDTIERPDR